MEAELIYDRFLPLYIWSYSLSFIFNRFSTPSWKLNLVWLKNHTFTYVPYRADSVQIIMCIVRSDYIRPQTVYTVHTRSPPNKYLRMKIDATADYSCWLCHRFECLQPIVNNSCQLSSRYIYTHPSPISSNKLMTIRTVPSIRRSIRAIKGDARITDILAPRWLFIRPFFLYIRRGRVSISKYSGGVTRRRSAYRST